MTTENKRYTKPFPDSIKNRNQQLAHSVDIGQGFPSFRRSLPMSLMRAREAVMRKFVPSLQEHGLSPQQWRVMRALHEEEGLDISELSRRCFLLKPSLTRIVQNLVAKKILKRQQSTSDQRRSIISLTTKGHSLIAKIIPFSEERYAYITEKFGYGKLQLLYELLDELMEKLDESDAAADDRGSGGSELTSELHAE